MFCILLFVFLSHFFWPLHCLFFFDLRLLISSVVSCLLTANNDLLAAKQYNERQSKNKSRRVLEYNYFENAIGTVTTFIITGICIRMLNKFIALLLKTRERTQQRWTVLPKDSRAKKYIKWVGICKRPLLLCEKSYINLALCWTL